jgi:hypothetical protein
MSENRLSDVQWLRGGLYGAVAYIIAVALTVMFLYFDHMGTIMEAQIGGFTQIFGLSVAIFYEVQYVFPTRYLWDFGMQRGWLITPVYYVIPAAILLLISSSFVYTEVEGSDRLNALASGASLAIGYVVVSLILVSLLYSIGALGELNQELVGTNLESPITFVRVAALGIVYSGIVGGVGGLVANEVRTYRTDRTEAASG